MSLRFIAKNEQIHAIKLKARYTSHFCILRLPEALATLMLRVCSLAGEALATFSAEEVEGKRVHQLKSSLAKQIGVTRFRQKLFAEDHSELHYNAAVPCCDMQLVVLNFVQAEEEELEQLVSACNENRPDEVVDLLRKPLNPELEGLAFSDSLRLAAANGNSHIVQLLLEAGTDTEIGGDVHLEDDDVYFEPAEWRTALHLAAESGHSDVVKLLLGAGADKDKADDEQRTALHLAAEDGHSDVVKLLLGAGADTDKADVEQRTALHLAAENGHSDVVKLLLAGADKDATDQKGQTTLHLAAWSGHVEVVRLMLEAGADKDVADQNGRKALRLAASTGHSEIVKLMLEAGADKDAAGNDGLTALHRAASNGHSEVVKLLLDAGAATDVADRHGRLPVDLASQNGHRDIVNLLQPEAVNPDGRRTTAGYMQALHLAADNGDCRIVQRLLEAGIDKDEACQFGMRALHFAAVRGHSKVMRILLEAGADKDATNPFSGRTALHFAAQQGHSNVVRLLLEAGATKDLADLDGKLPLDVAIPGGRRHRDIIKLLQPTPRPQKRQRLKR